MPPSSLIKTNICFYLWNRTFVFFSRSLYRSAILSFFSICPPFLFTLFQTHTHTHNQRSHTNWFSRSFYYIFLYRFVSLLFLYIFFIVRKSIIPFTWRANIGVSRFFCVLFFYHSFQFKFNCFFPLLFQSMTKNNKLNTLICFQKKKKIHID